MLRTHTTPVSGSLDEGRMHSSRDEPTLDWCVLEGATHSSSRPARCLTPCEVRMVRQLIFPLRFRNVGRSPKVQTSTCATFGHPAGCSTAKGQQQCGLSQQGVLHRPDLLRHGQVRLIWRGRRLQCLKVGAGVTNVRAPRRSTALELKFTIDPQREHRRAAALVSATSLGDSVVLVVAGASGPGTRPPRTTCGRCSRLRASTTSRRFTSASQ